MQQSHPFEQHGDALADPDAHRAQGVARLAAVHLVGRRCDQSRAAHAQRMTERDGAAVGVDVLGVIR